ncbi:MAG: Nif3-like dinuclear metal center hexameric protein [Planctomycetes bacterium]|nr:Nif3-like dinuclear metal center hexameric protein [Planctomycetota bacterium]
MTKRSTSKSPAAGVSTVADFDRAMERLSPTRLAQDWDNVGLLVGDPRARIRRVLLCIDLTPAVIPEAIKEKIDLILAYHPPIFKPINRLRADSPDTDAAVFECIRRGIAIYATHTALDAADGGTNDVIARACGIKATEPLEYVDDPSESECKLVVFVPAADLTKVTDAMFAAGAGHIGDYAHCSFRSAGQGTFLGGETTDPTIGERGRLETIDELRLETIVKTQDLPAVLRAMLRANSYDEPAFDIYPLKPRPVRGIGRVGALPKSVTLRSLARKLKRATKADTVQTVGPQDQPLERAIIVVGAAGSLPFRLDLCQQDVIVTGEIRHHDALTMLRVGCTAIALGHWASERPVLEPLARRLQSILPGVNMRTSEADEDPFRGI